MNIKSFLFLISTSFFLSACGPEPSLIVPEEYKVGQKTFHKVCANCHGPDALGKNSKAPGLIDEDYLPANFSDKELIEQIINGSEKMPAQKNKVNATDIDEIIKYLRYSQKAAGLSAESDDDDDGDDPA